MGFKEGDAEKLLIAAFRQFPLRRMPRQKVAPASAGATKAKASGKGDAESDAEKGEASGAREKGADVSAKPDGKVDGSGGTIPPAAVSDKSQTEGKAPAAASVDKADPASDSASSTGGKGKDPPSDVRRTEGGKQIPVGNGGSTERFRWTQTLDEATVVVPVPEGTRGKDLDVSIHPSRIAVRIKKDGGDDPAILDGCLTEKIRPDESTWSLEGGALLLTLDKVKKTWWGAVLEGDDEIDASLVDSTRNIGEYDEATQGAIRKILFDQRQERLGLPSSDEILGKKSVPPMPDGVEYIDQGTVEKGEGGKGGV